MKTNTQSCYVVGTYTEGGIGGDKSQPSWGGGDYWIIKFCMDTFTGIVSQPANDGAHIQVYPNRFTEEVSIALQNSELREAVFTLTDVNGKTIYRQEEDHLAPGYTKVLDLRQLPTGVYFVTVQTTKGQVVKRVVKE